MEKRRVIASLITTMSMVAGFFFVLDNGYVGGNAGPDSVIAVSPAEAKPEVKDASPQQGAQNVVAQKPVVQKTTPKPTPAPVTPKEVVKETPQKETVATSTQPTVAVKSIFAGKLDDDRDEDTKDRERGKKSYSSSSRNGWR